MDDADFYIFNKVYEWFEYKLNVIYPETKIGASYFLFGSDNQKLVNILKYLDTGITDYSMRVMNEGAFKEYFPDESLAEKFLRKPDVDKNIKAKSILKFGDTLFALEYDETGAKKLQNYCSSMERMKVNMNMEKSLTGRRDLLNC